MNILVINAGSSSLKIALFKKENKNIIRVADGISENIGLKSSKIKIKSAPKSKKETKIWKISLPIGNHQKALEKLLYLLKKHKIIQNEKKIDRIGHRVVHGGEKYISTTKLTPKIIREIKKISNLAPMHNPANIEGIQAAQKIFKNIPQFAIFDTAFHHTIPEKSYRYALPSDIYTKYHIRRYGFHGTSHEYVSKKATEYLKKKKYPYQKIISCHIGNGVSVTAIKNGRSIDTSMGFTPLEGVPMGTRCGSIDPSIGLYLQKILKNTPKEIDDLFNKKSGLKALSEMSSDMRDIFKESKKGNKKANLAITIFCYHIAKYIGSYCAALKGLSALIFTAGIGENAYYIRKKICDYFPQIQLDSTKNKQNAFEIQRKNSQIAVLVIPTDEEFAIAQKIC
ncbi:acetate kinase [Candidatus Peregrinibacteria bacterium]|nr:acetate kinase [Candidatus Peregrinibacteria bacterium]